MKRNFIKIIALILACTYLFTGCSKRSYDTGSQLSLGIYSDLPLYSSESFGETYAVIGADESIGSDQYTDTASALLVNDSSREALVAYNVHEKIYPASMTKIMTGLLVFESLENGTISLDDTVTLDSTITYQENNVVTSNLTGGCTITVKNLLYGLLISSYNDCAIILARLIAGDEDSFVEMMNEKAYELGATNTHFENCHGLHSDNHYTTAYDLYLIFSEFTKYDMAYLIDSLDSYDFTYTNAEGSETSITISATNGYISGEYEFPEGYSLGSWKSGTTSAAGSCLIIEFVKDSTGEKYIAVVAGAEDRATLYNKITSLVNLS